MLELDKIHLGDCLELMPSIPSKSVDMILCDLPYGTTACEWDSIIDMGKLWAEYERVIKDNGAIVLTANSRFVFTLHASNPKIYRYKWIWLKTKPTRFMNASKMPMALHEDILIFYKALPTYNPQMTVGKPYIDTNDRKTLFSHTHSQFSKSTKSYKKRAIYNNGTRYPTDIIRICNNRNRTLHPTQKPVALFEYLIKTYTNEGETVLDNCSGSGTTAIACLNSNRHFICIERDEAYYKKSLDRIADHEPLLRLI